MNQSQIDRKMRELDDFLCSDTVPETAMDISTLEGFFTALVIGPTMIMPSQYLPWVWDMEHGREEIIHDSMEQMQQSMELTMWLWNHIAEVFMNDPASFKPAYFRAAEWGAAEWCEGFLLGTHMAGDEWSQLWSSKPELVTPFLLLGDEDAAELMVDDYDARQWMQDVPWVLVEIHGFWLQRRSDAPALGAPSQPVQHTPKVGRNEPCPCGSGLKYKKCCGKPPTIH